MEEYEKEYPMTEDALYDMYYYDDKYGAGDMEGMPGADPEAYDSEDDALIFNSNDLANRIWEDNDWAANKLTNSTLYLFNKQ